MSQRSCEDCRWDVKSESHGLRMIQCGQGHARTFQKIITDCHAWEGGPKCWCEIPDHVRNNAHDGYFIKYCPECGKKLEAI